MAASTTAISSKNNNINQQQQNIKQFMPEAVSKYTQEKACSEVSSK